MTLESEYQKELLLKEGEKIYSDVYIGTTTATDTAAVCCDSDSEEQYFSFSDSESVTSENDGGTTSPRLSHHEKLNKSTDSANTNVVATKTDVPRLKILTSSSSKSTSTTLEDSKEDSEEEHGDGVQLETNVNIMTASHQDVDTKEKKKRMVTQETQCDPLDFETIELRTILPFRHLKFQHAPFKSIRTDLTQADVYSYNTSNNPSYVIPGPYELYEAREKQRVLEGKKKKFTKLGLTALKIHKKYLGIQTLPVTETEKEDDNDDNEEQKEQHQSVDSISNVETSNEPIHNVNNSKRTPRGRSRSLFHQRNNISMFDRPTEISDQQPQNPSEKVEYSRKSQSMGNVTSHPKHIMEEEQVKLIDFGEQSPKRVNTFDTTTATTTEGEDSDTGADDEDLFTDTDTDVSTVLTGSVNTPLTDLTTVTTPYADTPHTPTNSRKHHSKLYAEHNIDRGDDKEQNQVQRYEEWRDEEESHIQNEMTTLYKIDIESTLQQFDNSTMSASYYMMRILEHVKYATSQTDASHSNNTSSILSLGHNVREKASISLCNMSLISCPFGLLDAELLTTLDLSHNYLTHIPNWFCDSALKTNLTVLSLCHNLLSDVPEKFGEFKKLKELDLSFNKFEYIPHTLQHLSSITILDLSHNSICVIPPVVIGRLKHSLTELNLSYNNILEVPEELKLLRKLRYLKLSDNEILYSSTSNVLSKLSVEEQVARRKPLRQRSQSSLFGHLLGTNTSSDNHAPSDGQPSATSIDNSNTTTLNNTIFSDHIPSRVLLLLELLESERKFVRYMNIFNEVFYLPFTTQLEELKKEYEFHISYNYLSIIVPSELYSIVAFARTFLCSMLTNPKCRMAYHYQSNPFRLSSCQISHLFLQNLETIKSLYVTYPILYDKAVDFLRELQRVNPEFDRFLKSRSRLAICDGLSLESFLLLPIRRLPRYVQILQALMRCTPESHPDFANTKKALKKLHELLTIHQKNIFIINNKYKIVELQKKLKLNDLLVPNRFLLKEGKLVLAQSRGINNFKKEIMKQIYNKSSVMESVKELNPYFETFKAKLTGSTVDDLWEVRLTELTVYVYLFSDILIVKETNLIQKLVGKFYIYNLKGAMITSDTSGEHDKEFSIIVRQQQDESLNGTSGATSVGGSSSSQDSSNIKSSTKLLTFICENKREQVTWYNAIQKTLAILNPPTYSKQEELNAQLEHTTEESHRREDEEEDDEDDAQEKEEIALDHAYENYDRESVLGHEEGHISSQQDNSIDLGSPSKSNTSTPSTTPRGDNDTTPKGKSLDPNDLRNRLAADSESDSLHVEEEPHDSLKHHNSLPAQSLHTSITSISAQKSKSYSGKMRQSLNSNTASNSSSGSTITSPRQWFS